MNPDRHISEREMKKLGDGMRDLLYEIYGHQRKFVLLSLPNGQAECEIAILSNLDTEDSMDVVNHVAADWKLRGLDILHEQKQ